MKNTLYLCLFCTILSFCAPLHTWAQNDATADVDSTKKWNDSIAVRTSNYTTFTPSIPTTPQAEAFQRIGEYSVNNASGIPDINLPLFEIDHYGYKMPLALRYIPTPLRPGYNYDITGHGWALTLGSCISRTINSVPDENFDFHLSTNKLYDYYQGMQNADELLSLYNFQYDRFHVKLPDGNSFSFCICNDEYSGLQYVVSDPKYKNIQCNYSTGNISGFILYDVDGVKYTFDVADYTLDYSNYGAKTSWYLSRMDLPNSPVPIIFSYNTSIIQEHFDGFEEPILSVGDHYSPIPQPNNPNMAYASLSQTSAACNFRIKLLTGISFGHSSIAFSYENTSSSSLYNYLRKITVSSELEVKRVFNLSYSKHDVRGKPVAHLTKLSIKGSTINTDSLVYNFTYYGICGFSGTDHWGNWSDNQIAYNIANMNFYAGFDTSYNSSLYSSPLVTVLTKAPTDPCPYSKLKIQGVTTVNEPRRTLSPGCHGVLRSITYPTGGRTVFEFENHRFVTATAANGDYIATKRQRRVIEGGGFRIQSITNYTSDGKIADIKQYRYGPTFNEANLQNLNLPGIAGINTNQHIGFGEPVVDPNILTYARFSTYGNIPTNMQNMIVGLGPYGQTSGYSNQFYTPSYTSSEWKWECRFSPVFFRTLLNGRNAVVYSQITEYHGDIGYMDNTPEKTTGKIVYNYDIYDGMGDSTYYVRLEYVGNVLTTYECSYIQDNLKEKCAYSNEIVYTNTFKLVQRDVYSYETFGGGVSGYLFTEQYLPGYYPSSWYGYMLFQSRYKYLLSTKLSSHTTSLYRQNGTFTTTKSLSHNEYGLVTTRALTGPQNITTTYTYPTPADTSSVVQQLVSRKMMSALLQSRTVKQGMGTFDVSGYKQDYASFNGNILPSKLYKLSVVNGIGGNYEEEQQVLSYSSNGNPLEIVDRSGMHTVYQWGHNDRYLTAEIKNATSSQVSAALQSGVNLRSALPNALVTTWTYSPLVGTTSQTDPSGIRTHYDYDGLGRLKEVYRYVGNVVSPSNKQILKQFNYHTITH